MKRLMYSGKKKCKANCLYCFAKWDTEDVAFKDFNSALNGGYEDSVIYPCCNAEYVDQEDDLNMLERIASNHTAISISTKHRIGLPALRQLKRMDEQFRASGKGFIKYSVSLTNKYRIDELEAGTASYDQRIELLHDIYDIGLSTSIIVKPILPFIGVDEYKEIVDDTLFVGKYLLGDLYVKEGTPFFEKYIKNKYVTSKRNVGWIENHPTWSVVECADTKETLKRYISVKGGQSFESDIEFIRSIEPKAATQNIEVCDSLGIERMLGVIDNYIQKHTVRGVVR